MTREMMQEALNKIPAVVAQMAAYYQEEGMYIEVVEWFNEWGTMYSRDTHVVTEAELLNHIQRAHRKGFDIDIQDAFVQVVRHLTNGDKIVVRYYPTESSGEVA